VQTSLIGSMLSNLLLVLGMCFFFGGINRVTQHFNITVAQTASSMLAVSIGSLIIPTAFQRFGNNPQGGVGPISRGTSVILLLVYLAYLTFQLKTHVEIYNTPSQKSEKKKGSAREKGDTLMGLARIGAGTAASAGGQVNQSNLVYEEEEEETPALSVIGALVTLTIATVFIAFNSEFMVSGIDYIVEHGNISEEFVGLILVPIVGNAAGKYSSLPRLDCNNADIIQNTLPLSPSQSKTRWILQLVLLSDPVCKSLCSFSLSWLSSVGAVSATIL